MSVVNLVSGGLDSTLIAVMMREEGIEQFPLFIDYGQRAAKREWETCQAVHSRHGLPSPVRMDLSGYGAVISTGLTRESLDIRTDAFTPGRNLMFLLMGAAYAHQVQANSIALGLLSEKFSLFPDQRSDFLAQSKPPWLLRSDTASRSSHRYLSSQRRTWWNWQNKKVFQAPILVMPVA
jgi:7-cyano-7-deazaguanine synthase